MTLLDTDTHQELVPDLEPVSWLIDDFSGRQEFLERLDPDRKLVADQITQYATHLKSKTGWDSKTVIKMLGCPAKIVKDFGEMPLEKLEACHGYMDLLCTFVDLVDTAGDVRQTVVNFSNLYVRADRDIDRVWEVFRREPDPAYDLQRLGEVSAAFTAALAEIDGTYDYKGEDPFAELPMPHISAGRLEAFLREDRAYLGTGPFDRMQAHIDECDVCRDERDSLAKQLRVSGQ